MPEAIASSDVGTYFGKYFLMKKLAAGGMGEIFLAKQQGPAGFQKILVVKKILPHLTENKEFVEAFLGEARLAAQMNHRNIVQVFELGEEEGSYFIAMEYVQGKSLRDVIDSVARRREKIPAELCRTVIEQICDGASYAHNLTDIGGRSLNLVHRDLNPQNVLISYTGDVKIIDFGIAKSEMSTVKTEAGMIKGKFVYMSPEQSLAKKLDKRSDIFAIGISLYEMLTGINPFHKNNIVLTLEAVQRYEPPPPSEYDPSYAPFDPIIAKALAKDRDRRYADASEMQDDLRRVVVPRPPERLGQFMARLFRAQLEEEQKLLMDSDQRRIAGNTPKRTPPRAAPTPTLPTAPAPGADTGQGSTMMLSGVPARAKPVTPPKPASARPAPVAKRPAGAGDTLVDAGDVATPPPAGDDVPGGTAMLKPGQAVPPPPARKVPPRTKDTVPDTGALADEGAGSTEIIGPSPKRPVAAKKPAPRAPAGGATDILTPEESAAAQQEALAKLQEAKNGAVHTRTREDKRREMSQAHNGRTMWIALGVGTLVAVALIVGLLFFFFADDSSPSSPRHGRKSAEVATPVPVPEDSAAKDTPAQEDKAPATAARTVQPADDAPPRRSAKALGMLTLNPGPNVAVTVGGTTLPRQVGAFNLPVTAQNGRIDVGDESTAFRIGLEYVVSAGVFTVKVSSTPRGVASVNGKTVSIAKLEKAAQTVVEVKKPGEHTGMTVRLTFRPN